MHLTGQVLIVLMLPSNIIRMFFVWFRKKYFQILRAYDVWMFVHCKNLSNAYTRVLSVDARRVSFMVHGIIRITWEKKIIIVIIINVISVCGYEFIMFKCTVRV